MSLWRSAVRRITCTCCCDCPLTCLLADAAQKLKANSSRWLGENGTWFGWRRGYGAFSVSPSNVEAVAAIVQEPGGASSAAEFRGGVRGFVGEDGGLRSSGAVVFE